VPTQSEEMVSIIIPAYNEGSRLPITLSAIQSYLADELPAGVRVEVVVVDNNSTDDTARVAQAFADAGMSLRVVRERRQGKGAACQCGVFASHGSRIFICDADLSMPMHQFSKFLDATARAADVLIGSREGEQACRVNEPPLRHAMGRVSALLTRCVLGLKFKDTQCGYKMFSRAAAQQIFSRQTLCGWGFDFELLYLACQLGLRVREVGIEWHYRAGSRVRPIHDAMRTFRELLQVRTNARSGRYHLHGGTLAVGK
jgi:dolichyl-phosphate beta-glucosyltransferase